MAVLDFNKNTIERTPVEKVRYAVKTGFNWTAEKVKNAVEYVKEKPQEAATIVGMVLAASGGVTKVAKVINRHVALRQEKYHREREVYDHSTGMYLQTRRKLRKDDIDRINRIMRETGKKKSEVMSELNLLKR